IETLPPTRGRDEERRAFGLRDEVVIFTVVRCVPWKGVDDLIRLWHALPINRLLVVAGDGPELSNWQRLAESEGMLDRVRFLGRVDRTTVARWYAAADAFVLASGYEGWPHVVGEAASVGLPCFVSDRGGNPETKELLDDGVTVLPYQDAAAWKQALQQVGHHQGGTPRAPWTHVQMVDATCALLEEAAPQKKNVIMISYDRDLLDPASAAFQRVASLADQNHVIHAFVISRFFKTMRVERRGFVAHAFGGSAVLRLWRVFLSGWRIVRSSRHDAVITAQDPFAAGFVGFLISRFSNVPLQLQEHGDFFSGEWRKESLKNKILSVMGRWLLRRAERVRVVSERVKAHVMALGVPTERIDVIPVSMDLHHLFDRPHQLFAFEPTIVAPCRFVPQKGLDVLLEACRLLRERSIGFRLVLRGEGSLEPAIKRWIHEKGLEDYVTILGWKSVGTIWDGADLFVLSSRYEGFARTIAEAMAAGVPVVATAVGCVGSLFRPGIDGLSVPINDAQALADAIASTIKNPTLCERMRDNARERAKTFLVEKALHDEQRKAWDEMCRDQTKKETGPRFGLWVTLFVVFAFVSRAASVILFHTSLLHRETSFFRMVMHWYQGYGYSFASVIGHVSAYRSPGYLFFLTALHRFFSPDNTWAQAIAQNLVVVGVLWLVYVVGKRLVGKRAALVAGFLMACYPYTFYHYTQYYHTFLSSFFLLLVLFFLLRLHETKRWLHAVAAGLSIACLAYIQGTILPAAPFLAFWLLWMWWPDWKTWLKRTLVMALCAAALIAPWTYRNWRVFHAFVPLTTDLGFGMAKANNENIYALTVRGYPQEVVDDVEVSSTNPLFVKYHLRPEIAAELQAAGALKSSYLSTEWHPVEALDAPLTSNEVAINQHWTRLATQWYVGHWWTEGAKLQLLKIKTFWQPSLFPSVKMGAPWPFAGWKAEAARWSVTLSATFVIFGGWIGLLFLLLKRRNRFAVLPFIILVVYTGLHSIFAGYTKYRIPLDNILAMYAGWVIVSVWDRWKKRTG
ncbi:MAG: glycosyltransferase, partial [bacterium]|nr:glycosyltransferase [bacterium]